MVREEDDEEASGLDKIIRRSEESLLVKLTNSEIKYREKFLPNLSKLRNEQLVCTVCDEALAHEIRNGGDLRCHKSLRVLVCEEHYQFYEDGIFSADEDGDDKYCRWCAQGGELNVCSTCTCTFCKVCLERNLSFSALKAVEKDDWQCPVCAPRPIFGSRTICWGALQLNRIGKEKKRLQMKLRKEKLENIAKMKRESEKKKKKSPLAEALDSPRKRRQDITDSDDDSDSSMPYVPAKKPKIGPLENGQLNGHQVEHKVKISGRKKYIDSTTSSEEDSTDSKKISNFKHQRRKKRKTYVSDESSEELNLESGMKSSDESEKQKSPSAEGTVKNKTPRKSLFRDEHTSSSLVNSKKDKISGDIGEECRNENKPKTHSCSNVDEVMGVEMPELIKEENSQVLESTLPRSQSPSIFEHVEVKESAIAIDDDSDNRLANDDLNIKQKFTKVDGTREIEECVNGIINSKKSTMNKNRLEGIGFLLHSAREMRDLGEVIGHRAIRFRENKINKNNISSFDDVFHTADKLKTLFGEIHYSYSLIGESLDANMKSWKSLLGLDAYPDRTAPGLEDSASSASGNVVNSVDVKDEQEVVIEQPACEKDSSDKKPSFQESVNLAPEEGRKSEDSVTENENCKLEKSNIGDGSTHGQTVDGTMDSTDESTESAKKTAVEECVENISKDDPVDLQTCSDVLKETSSKMSEDDPSEEMVLALSESPDQSNVNNKDSLVKKNEMQNENSVEQNIEEGKSDAVVAMSNDDDVTSVFHPRDKGIGGNLLVTATDNNDCSDEIQKTNVTDEQTKITDNFAENDQIAKNAKEMEWPEKSEDEDDLEADDDEVQVPDENEVDEDDEALQSLLNASSEDEIGASESDEDVSDEMSIEESDVEIKKIVKIVMKKRVLAKKNKSYVNPGDGNAEQDNTELEISSGEDKSLKEDESSDDESDGTVGQQDNEENDIKKTDAKENASPPNDDTDVVKKITISEKDDAEVKNQESEPDGKADASQQEIKDGVEENNQLDSDVEIEQLTDLSNLKRKKGNIKYVFETNEDGSGISSSDSDEEQSEKKQRKPYNKQSKQKRIDEKNELLGFLDDSNKQEDEDVTATTNKELERLEREAAANESSSDEGLTSLEAFTRKMHEENRQMEAQESSRHLQQLLASSSDSDPDSADELDISDLDTRKKKDKHKKIVEKTESEVKDKEPDSENADEELDKNSDSEQKENEIATEEQSDSGSEKRCKELDENPDSDKEEQNEGGETDEECDEQIAKPSDETKRKELSSDDSEPEAVAANDDDDGANDESSDNGNSSEGLFRDKKRTKRNSWRQDKLLRTKISETDTSDEERWWKRNARRLRKKDEEERLKHSESDSAKIGSDENKIKKSPKKRVKPTLVSSNEEDEPSSVASSSAESSDSSIFQKKKKKRKKGSSDSDVVVLSDNVKQKKKKRRQANSDNSSDESGKSDDETIKLSQKSELGESPGKGGRKNIRKVMTKHDLAAATRAAARAEDERKRRIAARQKLYNELFEVKEAEIMEKLVLDFDADTKTELISVNKDLVAKMKPHQAKGVKFMWDSCFESLNELKSKKGSGCILAHCMGLGKTFQVVSLVHTILVHEDTCVRTVLVVCPLSTVLNWAAEFRKWLKGVDGGGGSTINVHNLTQSKTEHERSYRLKRWHENGGVMIMGYEMFRTLTGDKGKKKKAVRPSVKETYHKTLINPGADLVVCDEGHTLKNETTQLSKAMSRIKTLRRIVLTGTPMQNNLKEYHCMVQFVKPNLLGTRKEFLNQFVNPISNGQFVDSTESDVKVMKRRAHVLHKMLEGLVQRCDYTVLTPFLPPKQEYVVSLRLSAVQERLYKFYLAHFAQRAGTSGSQLFQDWQALGRIWTHPLVLKWSTDKYKRENENQVLDKKGSLFSFFNKHKKLEDDAETGSLKDFINDESSLSISLSSSSASSDEEGNKRPKIKKTKSSGKIDPNDLPTEINLISSEEEDETEKEKEDEGKQKGKEGEKEHDKQDENDAASNESNDDKENKDMNKEEKAKDKKQGEGETAVAQEGAVDDEAKLNVGTRSSDWWSGLVGREQLDDLNSSAKLVVLLAIIRECELIEDKVLVFSQSLFSLNLIEHFLRQLDGQLMRPSAEEEGEGEPIRWVKNKDYLRLDGSTPTESRSQWCREFNRENNNRLRLFLISTRAGGLGINLTAANRVVIFDASWNPSHDIQSIFRIYRFGQKKPCYVYRFIAHGTMEEKVYERQVAKQSLASRVVDEQQIHRHYSTNDLGELYTYTAPLPRDQRPTPALPKDRLMAELLTQHSDWIEKYHEHDSLLENVAEEELNEEERQAAWDDYENDKKRAFLPITQQTGAGGVNYQNEMVFKNQMELYYKSLRARYPAATEQQMSDMLQSLMTNWFHQSQPTTPQAQASGTAQQQPTQPGPSTSSQQFTVPTYTAQQLQNFEKNLAVNMQTVQGGARQRGDIIGNAEIRKQNAAVNMQTVQGGARQRGDIIGNAEIRKQNAAVNMQTVQGGARQRGDIIGNAAVNMQTVQGGARQRGDIIGNAEIRKQNAAVNMQTVQGGARQRGDIIGNAEIRKQNAAMRLKGDGNGRMAYSNLVRQQNLATAVDKLKSIYPNGLPRQRQRVNTKPLPGNPITPTQNTIANTSRVQNAVGRMQPNTSHVQNQSVNSRQLPSNLRRIIYPNATSQPNTLMRNGSGRIQHNTARTQSPASVQNARLVQPVTRQARLPNTLQTGRTSLTPNLNPVTGASQLKTYSNKAMMRSVLNNQSRLNEKLMQRKGTEQMNANANARQLEEMSKRYKSSRGPVTQPPKKISVVTLDDDTNNQPD